MKKIYSKPTEHEMELEAYIFKNAFKKTVKEIISKNNLIEAIALFAVPVFILLVLLYGVFFKGWGG